MAAGISFKIKPINSSGKLDSFTSQTKICDDHETACRKIYLSDWVHYSNSHQENLKKIYSLFCKLGRL
jgi:hypothetical protein